MLLFRRLPFGPVASAPIFDWASQPSYPDLAERFRVADQVVGPAFDRCDIAALSSQKRFRQIRLVLLLFAALTAIAGTLQVAYQDQAWPGLVVVITGLVATFVARIEGSERAGPTYLAQRARAEELRSLYFRFLVGEGGGDERWLERAVATIEHPTSGVSR